MGAEIEIPEEGAYRLDGLTVPASLLGGIAVPASADGLAAVSLSVDEAGTIAAIEPATDGDAGTPAGGRMTLPCFVDVHTHLDKGHIWPRRPNPDGSFPGALDAVAEDRAANWSAEDVRHRMTFALDCAYAQGTKAIRTHLDSVAPQYEISWPLFAEVREEWRGRIALDASPLYSIEFCTDRDFLAAIADTIAPLGGPIGAVTYMVPQLQEGLDNLFRTAMERGFDLDFHVDETGDPDAASLGVIAETAKRFGYQGKILCGHCCSLAVQPEDEAARTLDLLAETGIGIVTLPMCNMYLQDRQADRTPRWRGVTLLHEMKARGIPVMVASDNTRDPFYAYGDLDMWEAFRSATRTLHLDHPTENWIETVTSAPADWLDLADAGRLKVGDPADLVIFRGRSWSETLSRAEHARIVIRQGRAIETALPDYDRLDRIVGAPAGRG